MLWFFFFLFATGKDLNSLKREMARCGFFYFNVQSQLTGFVTLAFKVQKYKLSKVHNCTYISYKLSEILAIYHVNSSN